MYKVRLKKILSTKLVKNGMWMFALQGMNSILPFLTLPYITRILTASIYGDFSLSLNIVGYLQVIVEYGFTLSGARKLSLKLSKTQEDKLYSRIILSRGVLCLVSAIVLITIETFSSLSYTIKKSTAILFFTVIGTVMQHTWFFQGKEDMKFITIANAISRSISTVLIFLLIKKPQDIYLYCALYSLNFVTIAIIGFIMARLKYKMRIKYCHFYEIFQELKDGWYLFTSAAITTIFSGFGVTYLGLIAGSQQIGIYSAINKLPTLLLLLWMPVGQVLYPYISRIFADSWENGIKHIKKIGIPIFGVYGFIGFLLIAMSKPIVSLLFGTEYTNYFTLAIPLILWVLIGIINNFLGIQTLVASGHSKDYSKAFSISVMATFTFTIVLGYQFTMYGVAWASFFSELFMSILLINRITKIKRERASM